jgi:ABC-type multidrug transport system fused ATPase/permease subunit
MQLNSSWYQAFVLIGRWLAFRLDLISATSLAAGTLLGVALRGRVSVSLLGLALSYTLQLPGLLQWTVRQSTEVRRRARWWLGLVVRGTHQSAPPRALPRRSAQTSQRLPRPAHTPCPHTLPSRPTHHHTLQVENNMTSVERLLEYTQLPQEPATLAQGGPPPPPGWPASGEVVYRGVSARYRPGLPPVLRGLSFTIPAGSSCGVVGRTGSGKSSLMLTLFRCAGPRCRCAWRTWRRGRGAPPQLPRRASLLPARC